MRLSSVTHQSPFRPRAEAWLQKILEPEAEFRKFLLLVLYTMFGSIYLAQYHVMLKVSGKTAQLDVPHPIFKGLD